MDYPLPLLPTVELLDATFCSFWDYPFFTGEETRRVAASPDELGCFADKLKEIARAYPGAIRRELRKDADLPDDPDVPF